MKTNTKNITQKYIQIYKEQARTKGFRTDKYLKKYRKEAIDLLEKINLPDDSKEEYQYTPIYKFFEDDFLYQSPQQNTLFADDNFFKCNVLQLDAYVILIVDGSFVSNKNKYPKGVHIENMSTAFEKNAAYWEKYYNQQAAKLKDGTFAINTAFAEEGIFIRIEKNTSLDKPIQIINLQTNSTNKKLNVLKNVFVIEENAEAKIIFCDEYLSSQKHINSVVTEVFVNKQARLSFVKMQNEHDEAFNISSVLVEQKEQSTFRSQVISLAGGQTRNNLYINLNGEQAETFAYGLSLIDKKQKTDNYTFIHHAKPNCKSYELYKNIIDEQAVGGFYGKVLVAKDAQKTNATQSNNNIVLTNEAKMKTKPQLVIFADDVKCSHGATVGQLDEEALFYMRARGIEKKEAQMLLMHAFVNDIIYSIDIKALRENIEDLVQKRLNGELSLCSNCVGRILESSKI